MTDTNGIVEQTEIAGVMVLDLSRCELMNALNIHHRTMTMPLVAGMAPGFLKQRAIEQHEAWHKSTDVAAITQQLGHAPTCNPVVTVQSTS